MEWKYIKGYNKKYIINKKGVIYMLWKYIPNHGKTKFRCKVKLKPKTRDKSVCLYTTNKQKTVAVSTLLFQSFGIKPSIIVSSFWAKFLTKEEKKLRLLKRKKKYYYNNLAKMREKARIKNKENQKNLTDSAVSSRLKGNDPILYGMKLPKELIETKRKQLKLWRQVQKLKHTTSQE